MASTPFLLAGEPARRFCLVAGPWWGSWPTSRGRQVAVLRLHVASFRRPRNERIILLYEETVCAPEHQESADLRRTLLLRASTNRAALSPSRTTASTDRIQVLSSTP